MFMLKRLNILLILLLLLVAIGCEKKPISNSGNQAIPVKVKKVELQDLATNLEYVGNIKAQDEANVYPKVSGKIIDKLKEDGSIVEKGEAIVLIDRDEVGLKFNKAPVESPMSGVVGRVYVDIGSNVSSQTPVALVVNMDKVKIYLDIPEVYLPKVFLDQEAVITVDAYPQEKFLGKVTRISPVVNLENRAAPIEITIDNPEHHLKSGMFVSVSLTIEKHPHVPVVLKEAILGKEPDTYVYTVSNNKAKMRKISLGIHEGPLYEAADGINEGDMVVIVGQQRLYDDAPVIAEISNGNGGNNQ